MRFFWLAYFCFFIVLIGGPLSILIYLPLAILGLFDKRFRVLAEKLFRQGVRLLLFCQPWLNLKTDVVNPSRKTVPGTLLIGNHRSHLDVFVLLTQVDGIRVLARKSLLYCLPLAPMLFLTKQILVPRGDMKAYFDAMETVRKRLREGESVHIFPEMTRCDQGAKGTRNFSLAPFLAAIQEKAPVVPVVIKGTDMAWGRGEYGISFRTPIEVRSLPALDSTKFANAEDLRNEVRRQINEALA